MGRSILGKGRSYFFSVAGRSVQPNLRDVFGFRFGLFENICHSRHELEALGFSGTAPEVSIYRSVLFHTGIHRRENGAHCFGAPSSDRALLAVWTEISGFLAECEFKRHTISDLFRKLQQPPYGLKEGVIPILFCAVAIAHDTEIAFYENGSFLPEMTVEAFERLVKSPTSFELRKYKIEGLRREVYTHLAQLFGQPAVSNKQSILSVVKPLFRFLRRLPPYCQTTSRLSTRTLKVRDALLYAKEPDQLLFTDLPQACDMEPFAAADSAPSRAKDFFEALRASITEMQRAYEDLLRDLQELLFRAFDESVRSHLEFRAKAILAYCVEPRLKALVGHLANQEMDETFWIEAVATTVVGKAPKSWNDNDRTRYEVGLAEMSRNIRHLEALVYEEQRRLDAGQRLGEIFRIGVAARHSMEVGAVVAVEETERASFIVAVEDLQRHLAPLIIRPHLALAVLASVSKSLLHHYVEAKDVTVQHEVVTHD